MRLIVMVVFVPLALSGCSKRTVEEQPRVSPPPTGSATAGVTAPPPAATPDAAGFVDCEMDAEDTPAGLHDRHAFTDPRTEQMGFKTGAGKIVIPARYAEVGAFTAGGVASVRLVEDSPNPWRFIDPAGTVLATPHLFDNGPDYWQEGHARIVDAHGKLGFISTTGEIVVPPRYDFAYPFCHGSAKVALGTVGSYLDAAGKPTAAPANDDRPLTLPSKRAD